MDEEDIRRLKRLQIKLIEEKKQATENEKPYNTLLERVMLDGSQHPITKIYRGNIQNQNCRKWVYEQLIYKKKDNNIQGPVLRSWIESENTNKIAFFNKFNITLNIPSYTETEYKMIQKQTLNSDNWSKEETDTLFDLLKLFEGNFLLVNDRWPDKFEDRTVEELKERAFDVLKQISLYREDSMKNDFAKISYNKEKERIRKIRQDLYIKRTNSQNEFEDQIVNELKKLEIQIKRKEKENENFKKLILNTDIDQNNVTIDYNKIDLNLQLQPPVQNLANKPYAFCRSCFINGPVLTLPPLTNKKIEIAMIQLEQPENVIASEENKKVIGIIFFKILQIKKTKRIQCYKRQQI